MNDQIKIFQFNETSKKQRSFGVHRQGDIPGNKLKVTFLALQQAWKSSKKASF